MKFKVKSVSPELPIEPFEIELASGNVVSFVGYNATLKSLTARALLYELCQRTDKRIDFIVRLERRAEKGALLYLVDDYRLSLRAYLSTLQDAISRLKSHAGGISDERIRDLILNELEYEHINGDKVLLKKLARD